VSELVACLEQAWQRRAAWFEEAHRQGTDAYRLFTGEAEGVSGLIAERYGAVVILQVHVGKLLLSAEALEAIADWYARRDGVRSVYVKPFVSDRTRAVDESALRNPQPSRGEIAPAEFPIWENGLRFLVRPYDGFSTGIFLDQRENRLRIKHGRAGRRVLNCFSYTCAFSVFAAMGGAEVTSVDLSSKYLEWGKANFSLNGIEGASHRFFATDVFRFFKAAAKREERYQLVIVDPPSFSRNRDGGTFSLKRDLAVLLRAAADRVEIGGEIFFSTNFSGWDQRYLQAEATRQWQDRCPINLPLPPVPADYAPGPSPIACVLARFEK
jgi:23S rRNA (cytosine1962-C5)-methyltransferase